MPIRINFLAEEMAAEEMRRRDPVKKAAWIAGICVAVMLLGSGLLRLRKMGMDGEMARIEEEWKAIEPKVKGVSADLRETRAVEDKLNALKKMAANRFLWAPALNALQQSVVDNVRITRLASEQSYTLTEAVVAKPGTKQVSKPATSTERIKLVLQARDTGSQAEQNYNRLRESLAESSYFKASLAQPNGVRLKELSPPQPDPASPGKSFAQFSIECLYPETVR